MSTFNYDPDTDSAYFIIEERTALESEEITDGIVLDYDENDKVLAVELLFVHSISQKSFEILNSVLSENLVSELKHHCRKFGCFN